MPTPVVPIEKLTPMLRQYVELKAERPDVILLMRVGDFYEAYGEDAETISGVLNITLTGREVQGLSEKYPMAGVPHHAMDRFLARLVKRGYKVAVCDQVEDPKQAKGLVKRR
ncbi:MAG: DNA mismatch repair protein MutS, partial [Akkermansiaceae bacterium]|nr:DNA mismatch repair protein MutS [Armatimonadota bacterium]